MVNKLIVRAPYEKSRILIGTESHAIRAFLNQLPQLTETKMASTSDKFKKAEVRVSKCQKEVLGLLAAQTSYICALVEHPDESSKLLNIFSTSNLDYKNILNTVLAQHT
jgi:hypothetical protein